MVGWHSQRYAMAQPEIWWWPVWIYCLSRSFLFEFDTEFWVKEFRSGPKPWTGHWTLTWTLDRTWRLTILMGLEKPLNWFLYRIYRLLVFFSIKSIKFILCFVILPRHCVSFKKALDLLQLFLMGADIYETTLALYVNHCPAPFSFQPTLLGGQRPLRLLDQSIRRASF